MMEQLLEKEENESPWHSYNNVELERNLNYDAYVKYFWPRSHWLEQNCLIGDMSYTCELANELIDDPLMQNVHAYNCVSRTYEGFNNANEDLHHRHDGPMYYKRPEWVKDHIDSFADKSEWSLKEWLFFYYIYRATGSGFRAGRPDHGYYNCSLPYLGKKKTREEMMELMEFFKRHKTPMFSTVGNQNPTPMKGLNLVEHFRQYGLQLLDEFEEWLTSQSKPVSIRESMDWMNSWNIERGMRRWNFTYAQMGADIATYHPDLIDPNSLLHCGTNARDGVNQLYLKPKGMSTEDFHDAALIDLTKTLGTSPLAHEDTLCIFVRFLQNVDRTGVNNKNNSGFEYLT